MQSIEPKRTAQVNRKGATSVQREYDSPTRGEVDVYEKDNEGTDEHENENEEEIEEETEEEGDDDDDSPDTPLPIFDWSDLETRYQAMINQKVAEETEVWNEFCRITDVGLSPLFSIPSF